MMSPLQKYLLPFAAFILLSLFAGTALAQENPTSSTKRNSPFSPNPKNKTGLASQNSQKDVKPSEGEEKAVKIVPAASQTEENGQIKNTAFESRSVAKKTLEVAKRASTAALSPTEIYKVGVGDVLFISLQNAPAKESTFFTVLQDGGIDYPLAGEMLSVQGLTTDEIETILEEKIKLYENPQVSVKVREHNSHSYTVLGLVEKSGEKFLQREAIPLYVVRAESIVSSKANQAIIKRANSQTETVDLRDQKYEDVLILPGDIVEFNSSEETNFGAAKPQFYYIGGAIKSGGQKDFYKGITLTQAILASGGLKKSNAQNVIIRRKNQDGLLVPTNYNLKAIKDGQVADPNLEAGDTIEIGN